MIDAIEMAEFSGLGKLSYGWKWIPLNDLCLDIVGGGTPLSSRREYYGEDIVWVTPSDLDVSNPCHVINDSETKLTALGLENSFS